MKVLSIDLKKVLIIQRRLTHYRIPFFEALKQEMENSGMKLLLAYGEPTIEEVKKNDSGSIEWATKLKTTYFFGDKICWQPFSHLVSDVDVIIIAHENKLIFNLIPQWFYKDKKIILWGHGENLQKETPDWRDDFKKITAKKADWWLAYTDMSVPLIQKSGFPQERITVLNNTIDVGSFKSDLLSVTNEKILEIRLKYNIIGNNIGIFIGSLYEEKRIEFLLESVVSIKKYIPDFEFIIAGDGKLRKVVESYSSQFDWIHYVGLAKGVDKAALLSMSSIMLNPGLVGLGILDSFISHTPMITTDCGLHSPEVVYLENMKNGIMTDDSIENFVFAALKTLSDKELLSELINGCKLSSEKYTLDNMALNFTNGIVNALNHSFYRFSK